MSFGIPDTEPLSYDLSSYAPTSAGYTTNNIGPLEPEKVPYYHPKPKRDLEYSLNNPRLSMKQRQFFEENGFVVIPKLVPEDLLDHCQERFLHIVSGKVNKGKSFFHSVEITGFFCNSDFT